jgi:hypothetical protein
MPVKSPARALLCDEPCVNGHQPCFRYVTDNRCVACTSDRNAREYSKWRALNPRLRDKPIQGSSVAKRVASEEGKTTYAASVPCKNGHWPCMRYTINRCCVDCGNERMRAKRTISRDRENELTRLRRASNKDTVNARQRAAYMRNPEQHKTYCKRYHERNPGKRTAIQRNWRTAHKDVVRAHSANRRARKRAAAGKFTASDIKNLRRLQRDRCAACRVKLGKKLHVDHIQSLISGGSNHPKNLQLLCGPCNSSKRAKDPIAFFQSRGLLL